MSVSLPTWDLSDLYAGIDDHVIGKEQEKLSGLTKTLANAYREKITEDIASSKLALALSKYEFILQGIDKLSSYAHLIFSTHSTAPAHGAFLQSVRQWGTELANQLLFIELDLAKLSSPKLQALSSAPELLPWRHYLERQTAWQSHRLTEAQEQLLNDKTLTGRAAFVRLYDQEAAARIYEIKLSGAKQLLTQSELLKLWHSPKRAERRAAAASLAQGQQADIARLAFIYNMVVGDHAQNTKYHAFATPEAGRHLDNEIEQSTVDTMVAVVTDQYSLVQRYYRFKQRQLGLKKLYGYDKYAPLGKSTQKISFAHAQKIVVTAFMQFSPLFGNIAQEFFDKHWIDAAPARGKQGGAHCMFVTPDAHPYVLVNYTGTARDVLILAHELGHAIHAYLAREQHYLQFNMPITLAETASVFAEMLVFSSLRQELADRPAELLSLYAAKIEDIFATVFRQTTFHQYEQALHARRAQGELAPEDFTQLWREGQQRMFGRALTLSAHEDVLWSVVPHFIHNPFYVYAYAFGALLTLGLFNRYQQDPAAFVPRYTDLLKAGGSQSPRELLQVFEIDLQQRGFWESGMAEISTLVDTVCALGDKKLSSPAA